MYFSFNRDTSKWVSKLGLTNEISTMAEGVTLSNVVFKDEKDSATLNLLGRSLPNDYNSGVTYHIEYSLERDNFGNYKHFNIKDSVITFTGSKELLESKTVWLLNVKASVIIESTDTTFNSYITGWKEYERINAGYYQS